MKKLQSILLSDTFVADAKACGEAKNRTAAEQIEFWVQLGKACEESPELPTPLVKYYLDGIDDDLDEIIHEMFKDPNELRELFQILDPSFDPFSDMSDPKATIEYLFHLMSTRLKK